MGKLPLPGNHLADAPWPKPPPTGPTGPPIVLPGGKKKGALKTALAGAKANAGNYRKGAGRPD